MSLTLIRRATLPAVLAFLKGDLEVTTHEILIDDDHHPEEAVIPTGIDNLDIMPASVQLAGAEVELINIAGREKDLKWQSMCLNPSMTISS